MEIHETCRLDRGQCAFEVLDALSREADHDIPGQR